MIFYLRPGSMELHPTQAAAGKGFIQHDVPVDKAGLMAYVNALRLAQLVEQKAESDSSDAALADLESIDVGHTKPPIEASPKEDRFLSVYSPDDCRMCARSPIAAGILDEALASVEVRSWISKVDHIKTLELLVPVIEKRHGEIS